MTVIDTDARDDRVDGVRGGNDVQSRRGSPTLRRRQLGMELRRQREHAGVTIDQVALRLDCSASKISRIETGHTGVTPRDVRDMLVMYNTPAETVQILVEFAREAREKGWWHLYGDVLTSAYVGLEAAADQIWGYEAQVVPGLLQTESYARALLVNARPGVSDAEVDRRVRVRTSRQSLLSQNEPIDYWVVLDEAVLRRPVGDPGVMRQQLAHLVAVAARPNVTLQVLPFAAGAHPAMDGTFTLLLYEGSANQNCVFTANAVGGLFLEKDDEIQRYAFIFDHLRSCSLTPDDSIAMIASLAEEQDVNSAKLHRGDSVARGDRGIRTSGILADGIASPDAALRAAHPDMSGWRKSRRSGPYSDNCVEVAFGQQAVGVRDSKDPTGPVLVFPAGQWKTFVRDAQTGRFDLS